MKIRVYGPGCARCQQLLATTLDALGELGLTAEIEKVDEVAAIAAAGVLRTPALSIDGNMILQGRVPGVRELVTILTKARDAEGSPGAGQSDGGATKGGGRVSTLDVSAARPPAPKEPP